MNKYAAVAGFLFGTSSVILLLMPHTHRVWLDQLCSTSGISLVGQISVRKGNQVEFGMILQWFVCEVNVFKIWECAAKLCTKKMSNKKKRNQIQNITLCTKTTPLSARKNNWAKGRRKKKKRLLLKFKTNKRIFQSWRRDGEGWSDACWTLRACTIRAFDAATELRFWHFWRLLGPHQKMLIPI